MMEGPFFSADGFDREALEIIVPRRATLRAYAIQRLRAQGLPYTEATADDVLRAALYEQVSAVQEQRYTATTAPKEAPEKDFQTLAHDLGFVTMVQEQQLYRFWKVGTFHPSFGKPTGDRAHNAAAIARVKAQFAAVLTSTLYKTKWAEGFVQHHLLRDPADAPHIAHVLSTTAIVAANQACDLACAWCTWGDVGLLTASPYPYASALLRVGRECQTLPQDTDDPRDLAARVRADVVALLRTLDGYQLTEAGAIRQERHIVLADESILHQPPGSPAVGFRSSSCQCA